MSRETDNLLYDRHNPGCRFSPDKNLRLYGRCGCKLCGDYRSTYVADVLSPIDERGVSMGSINMCDRCPSMVKGRALGVVQLKTSSDPDTTESITRELCPACIEDIHTVLMFDVSERPQRAFDKPFVVKQEADEIGSATAEQLAAALFEKLMEKQGKQITSS